MLPHLIRLELVERAGLAQYLVFDADLPDIVQQRRSAKRLPFLFGQLHPISDFRADRGDACRVAEGRWVASIDRTGQRLDRGECGLLKGRGLLLQAGGDFVEGSSEVADLISGNYGGPTLKVAGPNHPHRLNQEVDWACQQPSN